MDIKAVTIRENLFKFKDSFLPSKMKQSQKIQVCLPRPLNENPLVVGQGSHPFMTRGFDPKLYKIILLDQRGCGRSLPHASVPTTDMSLNTTWHLIGDLETLRLHLGVERWLICGASWGSALVLAYATKFPERVTELVLSAIFTAHVSEYQWLYHDVAASLPKEFEAFRRMGSKIDRSKSVFYNYMVLLDANDRSTRLAAARAWCDWEDAVVSNEPNGRRDRGCRAVVAEDLCTNWPNASLTILEVSGHLASPSKKLLLLEALQKFAPPER